MSISRLARAIAPSPTFALNEEARLLRERGEAVRGPEPQPPPAEPDAKDQYNFTDPESRIMQAGNGDPFEQAYNAQAAVEVESRLIVGQGVSNAPNDKEQLVPTVGAMDPAAGPVETVLADSGFFSERAVKAVEQGADGTPTGREVLAAVEKTSHHRRVQDLEKKADPMAPEPGASAMEVMRYRLKTPAGRAKYRLRQQTGEPVFGIIKRVMGFRRFLLRGLTKVRLEWTLVSTAYNLKRLHRMATAVG
jgi:hypothetical protein